MWKLFTAFTRTSNRQITPVNPVFENLEGRTLLSAPGLEIPVAPALAAPPVIQNATLPNVKGSYKGSIKITGYPATLSSTLVILTQSAAGAITGKISVANVGVTNFAVTGKIDAKGNITISWANGANKGTVKGKRAANGSLSGTLAGKVNAMGTVMSIAGTFAYTKSK